MINQLVLSLWVPEGYIDELVCDLATEQVGVNTPVMDIIR
jgi:hypothetical protein